MRSARLLAAAIVVSTAVAVHAASFIVRSDDNMIAQADAVVLASALESHVEDLDGKISTVTTLSVEDVLKGPDDLRRGIFVREPGGVIKTAKGTRFKSIAGVPHFVDGERVLLFLMKIDDHDYAVFDLALGFMRVITDDLGHSVIERPLSDSGLVRALNGKAHQEPVRDAKRFFEYIRNAAAGVPAKPDYEVPPEPLQKLVVSTNAALRPAPLAVFTITQYTFVPGGAETVQGYRWATFPSAVNWNRGNAETNVTNSGSDAINAGFNQWKTGSSTNFVLTSFTANLNGILSDPDGVNNFVFEQNLTGAGISAFNCTTGGVIGLGGLQSGTGTTSTVAGETFRNLSEADVSMNQGVGACIGSAPYLPLGDFLSGVTHETGHALGFRHSDRSRNDTTACASQVNYNCSSAAIMTSTYPSGLNGTLQSFDAAAVVAVYPPAAAPNAPTGITATATSATVIGVSWSAPAGGATKYHVYRCASACTVSTNFAQVNGETTTTTAFNDTVSTNTEYIYKVRAVNASSVESADSNTDIAFAIAFTDATITAGSAGTRIKAAHITELRTAAASLCTVAGNPSPCGTAFTDPSITVMSSQVKAAHINELRAKIAAARIALGLGPATFTDTITALSTIVKKVHIDDLRTAVN